MLTQTKPNSQFAEHTFLIREGRWQLKGHYRMDRDSPLLPIHGKLMVVWTGEAWFSLVGKICFPKTSAYPNSQQPANVTLQYKGHFGSADQQYTYMLQHSHLGQIEGEGWLLPESIVQKFWVLGDHERRIGLEHLYRIDDNHYHWSSSLMTAQALLSTMEATLERYH